jgi:hypothetical protein
VKFGCFWLILVDLAVMKDFLGVFYLICLNIRIFGDFDLKLRILGIF